MRCNSCWRELEGRAVTTTCGHLLCPEDANKILSNDGACPICNQVLSKSLMKAVEINPNDEWINMAMAGVSPQIRILNYGSPINCFVIKKSGYLEYHVKQSMRCVVLIVDISFALLFSFTVSVMKSAYRSVSFYIGQKDLEMQVKMNKLVGQCRQKCEAIQEKYTEKLEQVYTAYQKMVKRCQMMEQEMESLSKDKQELQEKFAEKCRQKRKLDEMYDQARSENESLKRSAIQPVSSFFPGQEPDLFTNTSNRLDNRDPIMRDWRVPSPDTPGPREDIWPARQNSSNSTFDKSGGPRAKQSAVPIDEIGSNSSNSTFDISTGSKLNAARSSFDVGNGAGAGTGTGNPAMTLRNLIISPIKRLQLSRSRPPLFKL